MSATDPEMTTWEVGSFPTDYTVSYDTRVSGYEPQNVRIEIPIPAGDYYILVTVTNKKEDDPRA